MPNIMYLAREPLFSASSLSVSGAVVISSFSSTLRSFSAAVSSGSVVSSMISYSSALPDTVTVLVADGVSM